jgi:hypothetical protein
MKTLLFVFCLSGCAGLNPSLTPRQQCRQQVCVKAARLEETICVGSVHDDFDDTCICTFRDNQLYITPRR